MDSDRIWAPWRLAYVKGNEGGDVGEIRPPAEFLPGGQPDCFLCAAAADQTEDGKRRRHIIQRTEAGVCLLNRFPYNNGHLLISPLRHVGRLDELTDAESRELQHMLTAWAGVFEREMNAEGFNIGLNLGRAAGAGVPGHLHWHLLPRWNGDTNFMPSIANVKVIPQALEALWEFLGGLDV